MDHYPSSFLNSRPSQSVVHVNHDSRDDNNLHIVLSNNSWSACVDVNRATINNMYVLNHQDTLDFPFIELPLSCLIVVWQSNCTVLSFFCVTACPIAIIGQDSYVTYPEKLRNWHGYCVGGLYEGDIALIFRIEYNLLSNTVFDSPFKLNWLLKKCDHSTFQLKVTNSQNNTYQ